MENRLGQQFGDYRLIEHKGSGANGDVYKGQNVHASDDSPVAVKVLQTPLRDQHNTKQFMEEVNVLFRLRHPNIIQLLDFGIGKNDHPFLVMNYAVGSLPKGRSLAPALVVNYSKQIAAALQHAHTHRVVHRDIKPDNILLGSNNEIWVSDFGIAIAAHRTETWVAQDVIGTLPYMAPEQFDAKSVPASDQYSLGIIVYEWLCGERPFHGPSYGEFYREHHFVPPPLLHTRVPTILPQVEQVVLKALAKDPQQRFPSILEFSTALEHALLPPRKIALFGYETGGGRNVVLWGNPQAFFSDAQYTNGYASWSKTKRSFTSEEVLDGIWIKASDTGNFYQVRFHSDGSLAESALFDPGIRWEGSWKQLDEVLRVNIGDYELDIFANKEGSRHSGIEFYQNEDTPCAYFTILHLSGWNKKRWDDMYEVVDLVHRIYEQVLSRRADESGLITYGAMLHRGEKSVREIVKILGHSLEYKEHFIAPFVDANEVEVPLELCYERFLGRNADDLGRSEYTKIVQAQGFDVMINSIIESKEYEKSFGEDDLPPTTVGLAVASRWPDHLECFYRGRDNQLWHCWWDGSTWSVAASLVGPITSAPTAIARGRDRIDYFYRNQKGHLCHRWYDGSKWCNTEENLGGHLVSAPAVASRLPDHLECFYRGNDNHLWHRYWYGSQWSEEGNLGGTITSAPATISWGGDRIDCFYRGYDKHLYHRWWDGSAWSTEGNLGGILTSAPAVASFGPNHLDCFYRNQQYHLCHRWWDGSSWSYEDDLGNTLASAPAVVSWGPNRVDCFYQNQDNRLSHRWWNGSYWSEEENLADTLA